MGEYYMYVVLCNDDSFYAGYTTDLNRRIDEHNTSSKGAKYTKTRRPVKLIYFESFESKQLAMRAEFNFKKLTRKQKEKFIYGKHTKEFSKS